MDRKVHIWMGRSLHPYPGKKRDTSGIMNAQSQNKGGGLANMVRAIAAPMMRLWLAARYRWLSRRYRRLVFEEINGVPLVILPDVFNPVLLRSGEYLARFLETYDLEEGSTVLDLGTGSGVCAIFATRHSSAVTAVDINPAAVRCARINATLNQCDDQVTVLQGDLFEPVNNRRFDLVIFNPPFYRGIPEDELDHAWRGEGVFERFSSGLRDALTPGGWALLLLSSDGEGESLLTLLRENDYAMTIAARNDLINEIFTIYEIRSSVKSPGSK
jgi:HemK-related putative methylase